MSYRTTFPNPRPKLVIEHIGGCMLGNCYSGQTDRITSRFKLSAETIRKLYELGLVGFGQEFWVKSQCDGNEKPAFMDELIAVSEDRYGKELPGPALNAYTQEPIAPIQSPVYVYECESRCDSGD